MLSPHTPSGTKVVCIDATGAPELVQGAVYTLFQIEYGLGYSPLYGVNNYAVLLVDLSPGDRCDAFAPNRFRPAELPKCLTELLNTAPIRTHKTVGVE